uniref:Uncharacterized protein n=1 Tax=Oryza rufipogon TaxID=4529 RepID=A0A0E0QG00_ORYRU
MAPLPLPFSLALLRRRRFPTSSGEQPAADAPALLQEDLDPAGVVSVASAAAAGRWEASAPARSTARSPPASAKTTRYAPPLLPR